MSNQAVNVRVVWAKPDDGPVSDGLRMLTQFVHEAGKADGSAGGIFGGEFGYGADFENDTFLLHRYCWCESDDCLWCGGSSCQSPPPRRSHGDDCYQTRLTALQRKYGTLEETFEDGSEYWHVPTSNEKPYEASKRKLCQALKVDYHGGNEIHCTCGADKEWKRAYDACGCDWHVGRGRFRFGPAKEAPHFWHKASGTQVRWYKYIGRSMEGEINGDWTAILKDCLRSLA